MFIFRHKIKEYFFEEQDRWFLWVPVLFACGIGFYFLLPTEPSLWGSLVLFESLLALAVFKRRSLPWLAGLFVVATVLCGFITIQLTTVYLANQNSKIDEQTDYFRGKITRIDHNYRGNERLILENVENFENKKIKGKIRISQRTKSSGLKIGQCAEMVAKIMPLPKAAMAGGYQFDRKFFYEGLSASGYSISQISETDCAGQPSWRNGFNRFWSDLRSRVVRRINQVLPKDEAGITAAIVAGERGGISRQITNNYRDAGLAHFLSISGLHMTMLAGLMFFLIRLIVAFIPPLALRFDSKKISAVFAIILGAFYLLISGAQVPTQRAFIMTFIVLLGVLVSRRAISMKTIAWAALIVLLISPYALIGASFQMSFAAVVVLIAFYEKYAGRLQRFLRGENPQKGWGIGKIIRLIWIYIAGIVVSDLVASLATLPFAIYHFNRIAVYTTLGNLLAGPVIGLVIMPFVLLALLLMPLGLDYWPLKLVGFGVAKVNEITAYVAALPHAGFQVLAMPFWGLLLIVFGGLWLCLWNCPWRKWGWLGIIAGMLSMLSVSVPELMISADGELVALKDRHSEMVILPTRGKNFYKQMWLEKTANDKLTAEENKKLRKIYQGKAVDLRWLDLRCDRESCLYKQRYKILKSGGLVVDRKRFDTQKALGASFYENGKIVTVRESIGFRPWNE